MPTFVLIRHAKADRPPGVADSDRDLTPRGVEDAGLVGAFLATALPDPGAIVSSPARRARRTAELVATAAGWRPSIRLDDRLYQGGVGDLLRVLSEVGTDPVVAFGHEPVWSAAVATLVGGGGLAFPTAAAACVAGDIAPGGGILRWLITPATLGGGRS